MASPESPWSSLLTTALLGTARQPWQPAIAPGQLGQLLAQLREQPPEAALLLTAGILSIHQQVGWQPETRPATAIAPCPPEVLTPCSPSASRCLQQILAGTSLPLLLEWLTLAAIAQQRIPELHLPALLDKGKQQRSLRSTLLPVLGQRGRWLAAQNSDWDYAIAVTTDAAWETGSPAARLLALQTVRAESPDRARAWLQSTWSQEAASDRAQFLATLQVGLSAADLPWLEQTLGDRSQAVRRIAADLLARLPDSSIAQQATVYTNQYVSLERQPTLAWQVQLPLQLDARWLSLGIDPQPAAQGQPQIGEKAWWLLQLLGATPLTVWTEAGQSSPAQLVRLTQTHEWQSVLFNGLALAAQRQGDAAWLEAIFRLWLRQQAARQEVTLINLKLEDLFRILSRDRQHQVLIDFLQLPTAKMNDSLMIWLLRYTTPPWSVDLTQLVIQHLDQHLRDTQIFANTDWELRAALKEFAHSIPVELTTDVMKFRSRLTTTSHWVQSLDGLLEILQFRQEMTQSFGS